MEGTENVYDVGDKLLNGFKINSLTCLRVKEDES